MAIDDLYRLIVSTNAPGGPEGNATNVFFYQVALQGGSISAENVADDFILNVLTPHFPFVTSEDYVIDRVLTQNLMNEADFNDTNPALQGTVTGVPMPSFVGWECRSPWPGTGRRRAYKRFPPPSVDQLTLGGAWSGTYRTLLRGLAATLGSSLELSGGVLDPVIVRRGKDPVSGATTYEVRDTARGVWEVATAPVSQVSRKITYTWEASDL